MVNKDEYIIRLDYIIIIQTEKALQLIPAGADAGIQFRRSTGRVQSAEKHSIRLLYRTLRVIAHATGSLLGGTLFRET